MDVLKLVSDSELELKDIFNELDRQCFRNSKKVLDAFHKNNISEIHFSSTTG